MDVRIYARPMTHQIKWGQSFCEGLKRHGIKAMMCGPPKNEYQRSDVAVFWSHRFQPPAGQDYIVLENAYLDREHYASAGWNGLNGRADFCNASVPDDRGRRFYDLIQPLRFGEYILIMGQVRGDMSIDGLDFVAWAEGVAREVGSVVSKPICFRRHPKDPGMQIEGARIVNGSLDEAIGGAHWVVTYNSSSAVEAALAGVPVAAFDEGSMAWPIAGHELEYRVASTEERQRWVDRLAYTQWTAEEMERGETWAHLRTRLDS